MPQRSTRLAPLLALGGPPLAEASVQVRGRDPVFPTAFDVGDCAAAALGAVGAAAGALEAASDGRRSAVSVDTHAAAASLLGFALQSLDGTPTPRPAGGYATVALYRARDGRWIHLHGGFPGLRDTALRVLGCRDDAESIAKAVEAWDAFALEDALAEARGCGAVARDAGEWRAHPQGAWLATRPVVEIERIGDAPAEPVRAQTRQALGHVLDGLRVLDLTRVLAGPTCARTLAAFGADVLKVSGPDLPFVAPFVMDTGHGKRAAHLDLRDADGRTTLADLVREGDVFSQGFRSGALERLGFGEKDLARLRPGVIAVSINCYGHGGPWRERAGWEQLAQTATGIAVEHGGAATPALIPAAACDYTTGYLAAFGVLVALARRAREGGSWAVRASLCQTAMWFQAGPRVDAAAARGLDPGALGPHLVERDTPHGRLRHLGPVIELDGAPARWDLPSVPLGTHAPHWLPRS